MIGRALWALVGVNVTVVLALIGVYPDLMLAPGPLVPGHRELDADCFACHAPLGGAASARCVACHTLTDIGLRTTKGVVLPADEGRVAFHQELIEQDCVACHSDHAGPLLTVRHRKPFSHDLVAANVRDACATCHDAPDDEIHADLGMACQDCHAVSAWKPATFRHEQLAPEVLAGCRNCHVPPADPLHDSAGACGDCHAVSAWKPADFDHDRYFVLDRDHDASCQTCHVGNDFTSYTCYGCHEHTRANIAGEHREEGIRDFEDCVACHRSADDEPEGRGGGGDDDD